MGFTLNQLEQERQIRKLQKKEDKDTSNYEQLSNLPKINNVELKGDKTTSDLGITASGVGAIPSTDKGANGGVAELDSNGKVPSSQLPDITALVKSVVFTQSSAGAIDVSAGNYVDVIIDTYSAPSGYSFLGIAYFSANKTGLSVNTCGMSGGALHIIIRNDTSSNITGARPSVRVAFVKSEYIVS